MFVVAGEADPIVKIANQRAMIEELRRLNGATSPGTPVAGGATFYKSDHGTAVETLIHARGHVLPREAPELIVKFFRGQEVKK